MMSNIKLFFILIIAFSTCINCLAQKNDASNKLHLDSIYTYEFLKKKKEYSIKNDDWNTVAYAAFLLGDIHFKAGDKDKTFDEYTRGFRFYHQEGKDSLQYFELQLKYAWYHYKFRLPSDASDIYNEILDYSIRKNKVALSAKVYEKFAILNRDLNNTDEELKFLNKAIESNKIAQDTSLAIDLYIQKAINHTENDILDAAQSAIINALRLAELTKESNKYGLAKQQMGIISYQQGKNHAAINFLQESDSLLNNKKDLTTAQNYYKYLAKSYAALEEKDSAFFYLSIYNHVNDSLLNTDQKAIINTISLEYENQQKQKQIDKLEREKTLASIQSKLQYTVIYSFLAGVLTILVAIFFLVRFYQQKIFSKEVIARQHEEINQRKIIELENNLKIETMHSMLAGQEAERERVAKDLHDSLGGLLSAIKLQFESVEAKETQLSDISEYKKANLMLDEACQEVRNISNNMQPGALIKLGLIPAINDLCNRFQGDHYAEIDFQHYSLTNENFDNTISLMVYRIIQELLTNSIKHAQASEILIQLSRQENDLAIMVEDDGIGYNIEHVKKGMGTENIASRVNFLRGDLSVQSVKGQGTSTMINIPLT